MHNVTRRFGESQKTLGATRSLFLGSERSLAHTAPANNSSQMKQAMLLTVVPASSFIVSMVRRAVCRLTTVAIKSGGSSSPVPLSLTSYIAPSTSLKARTEKGALTS